MIGLIPLAMGIAGFIGYRNNANSVRLWGALPLGLVVHVLLVGLTFMPMFFLVYAGAHTKPAGNALGMAGRIIWLSIEIAYVVLAFSIVSFIAGRERPWPLKRLLPNSLHPFDDGHRSGTESY